MSPAVFGAIRRAEANLRAQGLWPPRADVAERKRRERLARWQAPPLSRGWPEGMP